MRRIKSEDVMGYSVLELGMEVTNCVVASQLSSMHEWNTGMYSILLQPWKLTYLDAVGTSYPLEVLKYLV